MALFNRRSENPKDAAAKPAPKDGSDLALDAAAKLLRVWGQRPLPTESRSPDEIVELFEGWALHVLTATPPPGRSGDDAGGRRDWPGLSRFAEEEREAEVEAVENSISELGEVIWHFVQALGRSIDDGRSADLAMGDRLTMLREAVESGDPERLKREALESISLIEEQMSARQQRAKGEVDELASRLSEVTDELVGVRKQLGADSLTGIANRAALDDHLARVVSLGNVLQQPAILFMIDVDHFKWVNDKYGHPAGDEILKLTATTLTEVFRRRGDFVARYGGDEFAAVILDDSLEVAETIAGRMLFSLRDLSYECPEADEPIRISASVGVARLEPGDSVESWMSYADRALYQAKEMGRDRFSIATARQRREPQSDGEGSDESEATEAEAGA